VKEKSSASVHIASWNPFEVSVETSTSPVIGRVVVFWPKTHFKLLDLSMGGSHIGSDAVISLVSFTVEVLVAKLVEFAKASKDELETLWKAYSGALSKRFILWDKKHDSSTG
jgi:hypothetical protein